MEKPTIHTIELLIAAIRKLDPDSRDDLRAQCHSRGSDHLGTSNLVAAECNLYDAFEWLIYEMLDSPER